MRKGLKMRLESIKIWLVKGVSSLKAKADVTLNTDWGELALKGFRVVQTPAKEPFVAPPQEKYSDSAGKTAYKDILWLGRSVQQTLYPKIIEAFNKELSGHKP